MHEYDGHTVHLEYVGGYRPFQWEFKCPHDKPAEGTRFEDMPRCWQYYDIERSDEYGNYLPASEAMIQQQTECLVIQWTSNLDNDEIFEDRYKAPLPITQHPIKIRWWFDGPETFNAEPLEETPMAEHQLVTHARAELERLGEDPAVSESIIEAIEGFVSYPGHSGGSASIAMSHLLRLLQYRNLAPLTSDPDEWEDRTEQTGTPFWQNKRDSTAFSHDGGKTWWTLDDNRQPALDIPGFESEMTSSYVCCYDHGHEEIDVMGKTPKEIAALIAEHDNEDNRATPAWISVWDHTPVTEGNVDA